jgi:hypothetical protein
MKRFRIRESKYKIEKHWAFLQHWKAARLFELQASAGAELKFQISNSKFKILYWHTLSLIILAVLLFAIPVFSEEIDGLIVAVNGKVITEGDLGLAEKMNDLFLFSKSAFSRSRTEAIGKLVDLELLRQELTNFSLTQEDESKIEGRIRSLRDAHAGQGGWEIFLLQLGLQEQELRTYLRLESSILKFVDFRFRPFATVSAEEIKGYYEGKLADQLKKASVELPPLSQVASKIEEILREEKINASFDQWIGSIYRNSRIEYFNRESESHSNE